MRMGGEACTQKMGTTKPFRLLYILIPTVSLLAGLLLLSLVLTGIETHTHTHCFVLSIQPKCEWWPLRWGSKELFLSVILNWMNHFVSLVWFWAWNVLSALSHGATVTDYKFFSSNPTQVFLHQLVHCITNPCSSGFTLPVRRSLWGRSLTFYNPQTVILTLDQIYGGNISWFPSDVLQLLCLMNRWFDLSEVTTNCCYS